MIYHIVPAVVWQAHPKDQPYRAATLATEGFIHCTQEPEMLARVANRHYRKQPGDFLILGIEPTRVQAEIRWEEAHEHLFPHIYGPLNLDAVMTVTPFPRQPDGIFVALGEGQGASSR